MSSNSPNKTIGHLFGAIGVLILSIDSLLTRILGDIPVWTLIMWKYGFTLGIFLLGYVLMCWMRGVNIIKQVQLIGPVGLLAGILFCTSNITINYSFINGNISNTLVILAANPAFATIWNYLILQEIPNTRTLLTGVICISCVVYICVSEMYNNSSNNDDDKNREALLPILSSCWTSMAFGLYFVLLRYMSSSNIDSSQPSHSPGSTSALLFKNVCICIEDEEDERKECKDVDSDPSEPPKAPSGSWMDPKVEAKT